jgi:hypothetical protein
MRELLLSLAQKIALVLGWILKGNLKGESLPKLQAHLTQDRAWTLAIILASWELSKAEESRADLSRLLGTTGVTGYWWKIDLASKQLTPFVVACKTAQSEKDYSEAARRFFEAVQDLGELVNTLLTHKDFATITKQVSAKFPKSKQEVEKPKSPIQEEEELIIIYHYLVWAGWTETEAQATLSKRSV